MSESPHSFTVIRPDGAVVELVEREERLERLAPIVVVSRFMARRLARQMNAERPNRHFRFEVERLGLLRWAVVAHVTSPIVAEPQTPRRIK
jgi:hypothetical protein